VRRQDGRRSRRQRVLAQVARAGATVEAESAAAASLDAAAVALTNAVFPGMSAMVLRQPSFRRTAEAPGSGVFLPYKARWPRVDSELVKQREHALGKPVDRDYDDGSTGKYRIRESELPRAIVCFRQSAVATSVAAAAAASRPAR
jgi:hypothetical protein